MYDTIIIGAGMSGLAAGIRMAHYDQKVCILEGHSAVGGLNSYYRVGQRNFDAGLHAMTNYAPKGTRRGPLARILRQLRVSWDAFALAPQVGSRIAFPGVSLRFTNDIEFLESEIARTFPSQIDGFRRLAGSLIDYDQLGQVPAEPSARAAVARYLSDPLLIDMLFCPMLLYGGSREHDMDFAQFSIMFRSLFLEGLARPADGVRVIIKNLLRRFKSLGGELKLRSRVRKIITRGDQASGLVLEDGRELSARRIVSSAGWNETMRLCDDQRPVRTLPAGQLSFVEAISILDEQPRDLGHEHTIVFFNDTSRFRYENPSDLVDLRSGVFCVPNNFQYDQPLAEGCARITALANHDRWAALDAESYKLAKLRLYDRLVASAVRFVPDFRSSVLDIDMFTPTTIRRFTGHDNGAVYGAAEKSPDGRTHLDNLFVCGTDQGWVGIVGTIVSGITIANRYCLPV